MESLYCVLGAIKEEITEFLPRMEDLREVRRLNSSCYTGKLGGFPAVVGYTGVGKVMSAMVTQHLIDTFPVKALFFTGIAGSLNREYQVGDMVIAEDCVQYDISGEALGFKRGQIPLTKYRFIPSHPVLIKAAALFKHPEAGGRLHRGRILSGDTFVGAEALADWGETVFAPLKGDAVEMEGAAAGLTALVNGLPFLLCRVISDRAGEKLRKGFPKFVKRASRLNLQLLLHIFEEIEGCFF